MRHFRDTLTLPSRLAYLCWCVLRLKRPLEVRMKRDERILMRQVPAEDDGAAREVFVDQNYDNPRKTGDPVRRVVDLGANIGCSCLYWVREYPGCTIEAFEPHPVHLSLLQENLRRNLLSDRTRLEHAGYQVGEQVAGLLGGWRERAALERWIIALPPGWQRSYRLKYR